MTRKELWLREQAVLQAYQFNNIEKEVEYVAQLYRHNKIKKLYRYRSVKQREIVAIRESKIFLCRPGVYSDSGDCKWIDDIEALVKYEVTVRNAQRYAMHSEWFTPEKYKEISDNIKQNERYQNRQKIVCNMCLVACVTDKKTDYMWENYAENSEGVCLEYDFEDVLMAIKNMGVNFFPVRYVENREMTKDIRFGPLEYAEDVSEELMIRKYMLSCMTKDEIPYSDESEWRILCTQTGIPIRDKGKSFDFVRPSKIYLGENISRNVWFEEKIKNVADEFGIPTIHE